MDDPKTSNNCLKAGGKLHSMLMADDSLEEKALWTHIPKVITTLLRENLYREGRDILFKIWEIDTDVLDLSIRSIMQMCVDGILDFNNIVEPLLSNINYVAMDRSKEDVPHDIKNVENYVKSAYIYIEIYAISLFLQGGEKNIDMALKFLHIVDFPIFVWHMITGMNCAAIDERACILSEFAKKYDKVGTAIDVIFSLINSDDSDPLCNPNRSLSSVLAFFKCIMEFPADTKSYIYKKVEKYRLSTKNVKYSYLSKRSNVYNNKDMIAMHFLFGSRVD
ncbi:MAG: hypothetical protein LBB29_02550 [Holosporaceae bacterium]|nr:hypothetical protein [Holosporaceae bacterium]